MKLMLRSMWGIAVMLTGPILVIVMLSNAFSALMSTYEGVDEFSAGLRGTEAVQETALYEAVKQAGEEAGITFCEYPQGEIQEVMQNNGLAGFVELSEDAYVVYKSADHEVEGITLEYFMEKVMSGSMDAILQITEQEKMTLPEETLDFMPAVGAVDYYGIIEIVYFCWCGMVCAAGCLGSEKKYGIEQRFRVSALSQFQDYLGKYIPINLVVMTGMAVSTGITVLLCGIHWGNPALSALLICMMILAANAMGLMFYQISQSMAITVIVQFTLVWFMGFFGGSFETYMYSNLPDTLKHLSPIYYQNRALVELSCMGSSPYVWGALTYSAVIAVVCSGVAVLAGYLRKRGKA